MLEENKQDEFFMKKALNEAKMANFDDEVPVGAVVVCEGKVIGKGYNQVEKLNDVTAHAEILALTAASNYLGSKYLKKCKIYVTLEPCPMCAAAINAAQLDEVFFGTDDPKQGFSIFQPSLIHSKIKIKKGIFKEESEELLKSFFKKKR